MLDTILAILFWVAVLGFATWAIVRIRGLEDELEIMKVKLSRALHDIDPENDICHKSHDGRYHYITTTEKMKNDPESIIYQLPMHLRKHPNEPIH